MSALRFALLVQGPPYGCEASAQALLFAQALLARGHRLSQVFFYQGGVYNANGYVCPASDEVDLVAQWRALALAQGICLDVCVAAAQRRGVLDAAEAQEAGKIGHNLSAPFVLSGLGQLAEAALSADRLVQF
ncbi:sulfurtransferase complex subunit TusD [Pseudaeromonas paramecii]|uniref:Sulfurtransferase complex subunit TusD n=1 Tax=Pseudaeromonas paramecii TaxID=2138166 RepID=A0ABP8Q8S8_9GAMM